MNLNDFIDTIKNNNISYIINNNKQVRSNISQIYLIIIIINKIQQKI
jgi:hypothetical protein